MSFAYDANGDLATSTDVGGGSTALAYDTNHRMLSMKDSKCSTTVGCLGVRNVYDPTTGRVNSQSDALGRTTTFSYTPATTTIIDPEGNTSVQVYEDHKLMSLTKGIGTPEVATWSYTYEPATLGRATETDPNGHATTNSFDERGNLLRSTDPLGRTTAFTYNARNQITSVTDPSGITTLSTYDAAGNPLSVSRPLVGTSTSPTSALATTTFSYGDAAHPGDLTTIVDANAKTGALPTTPTEIPPPAPTRWAMPPPPASTSGARPPRSPPPRAPIPPVGPERPTPPTWPTTPLAMSPPAPTRSATPPASATTPTATKPR